MKRKYQAALLMVFVAMFSACVIDDETETVIKKVTRNYQPIFASTAPDIAQINVAYNYNYTVLDFDSGPQPITVDKNASDTCAGIVADNGDGTGSYTFTPTPAQLGTQCVVGLAASDGKDETEQNSTVDIGDENAAPYFTSIAPTSATEDVLYVYDITAADDNVAAQTLTITTSAFDTCGGVLVDNGNGTGVYTFTPDESDGGILCLLSLTVTDSMAASVDQNSIVTILEDNKAPTNNAPATASGDIYTLISFNVNPSDPDFPAQTLTCSIVTNDCSGGALNGCVFEWIPGSGDKYNRCDVVTIVNDGITDSAEVTTTVEVNIKMVIIPAGCFDMGDSFAEGLADELPVHNVCITSPFEMSRHEVTVGEYKACVAAGACTIPTNMNSYSRTNYYDEASGLYDDFPVIYVDWYDAVDYCSWIGGRLPTEAEWEYAARGGLAGKRYPWGDAISGTDANYWLSGDPWDNDTSLVEYYAPNVYGLYDMGGNVWEWVNDWYQSDYYSVSPTNDPQGPAAGLVRVLRGGCWNSSPLLLRVAPRFNLYPSNQDYNLGFRCARD